jgi:hypothetical protein
MINMQDDVKELKTMVRAIINGQSSMKADILKKLGDRISKVEDQVSEHRKETKQGFKDINNRADLIGKQLNTLDEDAPVGEEFAKLVKRVDKLVKYQNFATV